MSLASQKFQAAALALAKSGPIKQRLIDAYLHNLVDLDAAEVPAVLHQEFEELYEELNRVPPIANEGRICATVRKMSNSQADECAQRIVFMYGELIRCETRVSEGTQEQPRYIRRVG